MENKNKLKRNNLVHFQKNYFQYLKVKIIISDHSFITCI